MFSNGETVVIDCPDLIEFTPLMICVFTLLTFYCIIFTYIEFNELYQKRLNYYTDFVNVLQSFNVLCIMAYMLAFYYLTIQKALGDDGITQRKKVYDYFIISRVPMILLQTYSLFIQLRVYHSFAIFVRQVSETFKQSLQIMLTYMFLTVTFTVCFITIATANDQSYDDFFEVYLLTHRYALGDYELTEEDAFIFDDSNFTYRVYTVVFFFGSLLFALVLINMVVAVMSAAQEYVNEFQDAEIYKSKLTMILENNHLVTNREMENHDNLIVIDVDPANEFEMSSGSAANPTGGSVQQ